MSRVINALPAAELSINGAGVSRSRPLREREEAAGSVSVVMAGLPSLSPVQERLWYLDQLQPGNPAHNLCVAVQIDGPLHDSSFIDAMDELVERHGILRTRFAAADGKIVPILEEASPGFRFFEDLSGLDESSKALEVQQRTQEAAQSGFDLGLGPLFRTRLLRLNENRRILLLAAHEIVCDRWSLGLIVRELAGLYDAIQRGKSRPSPTPPLAYQEYAARQREWRAGRHCERQLRYWREQLQDVPPLQLSTDFPRPALLSYRGAREVYCLGKEHTLKVRNLARELGFNTLMIVAALLETVLSRWSGQTDVALGVPWLNRDHAETRDIIGPLENTIVLRTDLSGEPTLLEMMARIRATVLQAQGRAEVPFESVVDEIHPRRERNRSPLFQVMLAEREQNLDPFASSELTFEPRFIDNATAKFDLTLALEQSGDQIAFALEYSTDLFQPETIRRLLGHLTRALEQTLEAPTLPLSSFSLLSAHESAQILTEWNATARDYGRPVCMHELFEGQVKRTPDITAVEFAGQRLTYSELNRRANQVAHYLRELGVGPEVRVGICMERGIDMIVGLIGILKAGGAYVPLDPKYPVDRLRFMLKDSRAVAVLTHARLREQLKDFSGQVICLDHHAAQLAVRPQVEPALEVRPENLAYLIYTSGSTGIPKGVAIQHQSAFTLLHWAKEVFEPRQLACMLFSTSICFDLSIFEIFVPLSWGYRVIIVENLFHFPGLPEGTAVTFVNTVPSVMAELLRTGSLPGSVNTVALAGEALARTLVDQVYAQPGVEAVLNLYGPSEDTTYSTGARLEKNGSGPIPIGKPVANTQIYILDESMQPLPATVAGQLYIGGAGLARCYLDRPSLTAQSFVPNPFGWPGTRLYRTGDLARWRADGSLEYLGRADHQVKVRGFRIECGEIEDALTKDPEVEEAAVVSKILHGATQLIAYYVAVQKDRPPEASVLRKRLQSSLPEYMIPIAFTALDKLPLTPNGKMDRKSLMAREINLSGAVDYAEPRNGLEKSLAKCWSEVLRVDKVGIRDNFFDLGGHSLLAVQLVYKMNLASFQCSIRELQDHPTIESLVEHVTPSGGEKPAGAEVLRDFPLLPVQLQVMAEERGDEDRFRRPVPVFMQLADSVNETALIQALELWYKQDIFRLRLKKTTSGWTQFYEQRNEYDYCPIQEFEIEDTESEVAPIRNAVDVSHRLLSGLDVFNGPTMQVGLLRQRGKLRYMIWLTDHLFIDTNSFVILYTNFTLAYKQVQRHSRVRFPKDTVLCEWAEHLSGLARDPRLMSECGFWKRHFAPAAQPEHDPQTGHAVGCVDPEHITAFVDKKTTETANRFVSSHGISFEELCLGIFLRASRALGGADRQTLRMVGSGRDSKHSGIDLSRGLGWFSIEYPALFDLRIDGDLPTFIENIARQHRAYAGQRENYGILRYLNPETGRELATVEEWGSGTAFNCVGQTTIPRSREQVAHLTPAWTEVVKEFSVRSQGKHQIRDSALDPKHGPYRRVTFSVVEGTIKVSLAFFESKVEPEEMHRLLRATLEGFQELAV